jgi:transposase
VGLEATGVYGDQLAYYLHRADRITVSVINPAQIKAFAQARLTRTKTDGVDALVIAAFVATQHPLPWAPEDPAVLHLRALVERVTQLQAMHTQESNRLKAMEATENPPTELIASLQESLDWLDVRIRALKKRLHQHIQTHPDLKQQMELLRTIPGIAEWSAACVIGHGGSALTDRTCKQLDAHADLAPAHRQSGQSVRGKSRIAKCLGAPPFGVPYTCPPWVPRRITATSSWPSSINACWPTASRKRWLSSPVCANCFT